MNSKYVCFDDIIEGSRVYVNLFDKEIKITHSNDKLSGEKLGDYTVADYLRVQRSSNHKAIIGVVTTYNCNLRCSYCYEKGYQNRNLVMDCCMVHRIIEFIKAYIRAYNLTDLRIIFTGGEPLLRKDLVVDMAKELNAYMREGSVSFRFSIVTNGTIDFSEFIPLLQSYGLDLVQISLDGSEEIHNLRRKATFNAFKKSLDFISKISRYKEITTVIRTNIDDQNIGDIKNMLEVLKASTESENLLFSFVDTEETICEREDSLKSNKNIISSNILSAYELIKKYGFKSINISPFHHGCMNIVEEGCFIDPSGAVFKCGGMLGHQSEMVGNVDDLKKLVCSVKKYIDIKIKDECHDCSLFPACGGGCIYQKHYNVACDIVYKERILSRLRNRTIIYLSEKEIIKLNQHL